MKYGFSLCAAIGLLSHPSMGQNAVQSHPYWQQGGAEISVYELQQNRYQDLHKGQLITIAVKEDFLTDKQVKNKTYQSQNTTPILKRIELRKFATGLYDYSTFSSVFSPLDRQKFPQALKATSSIQEWCGTTFLQLNWKESGYTAQSFSYFEAEGDRSVALGNALIEEDLFNQIRFNPLALPQGKFRMIPALNLIQTQHWALKAYTTHAFLGPYSGAQFSPKTHQVYTIQQPTLKRTIAIVFESAAPHKIVAWSDSYPSVSDGVMRITKIVLKKQKTLKYWNLSRLKDHHLRAQLGLD